MNRYRNILLDILLQTFQPLYSLMQLLRLSSFSEISKIWIFSVCMVCLNGDCVKQGNL